MQNRLVLIEWEDSGQPAPEWRWLDTVGVAEPIRCQTVGFLVRDDKEVKVVAQNMGDVDSDARQVSGLIRIPTRAVTRITALAASKAVKPACGRGAAYSRKRRVT
jgi:hypothetical protein